jgi:hypothetical protein
METLARTEEALLEGGKTAVRCGEGNFIGLKSNVPKIRNQESGISF